MFQIGTPWFDGVEGVTQCPILPGEVFTYQFVVDRVKNHKLKKVSTLIYIMLKFVFCFWILFVAWYIHVSFTLWNAERIWLNRNDSSFSSNHRAWTVYIRLWPERFVNRLVSQKYVRESHRFSLHTLQVGRWARGKFLVDNSESDSWLVLIKW